VERATGRPVSTAGFVDGEAWIDFAGLAGTIPTVSFSKVLLGQVPASTFRGKVVVVGVTAPSLQDIHATPTASAMTGPEIQANAISTLLRGLPLQRAPGAIDVALILLLSLIPALVTLRLSLLPALAAMVATAALYVVAAQLAFDAGRIVSVVYPLLALVASAISVGTVHYFTEVRERRRTRDAFRRFIPAEVVDQVLAQADDELRLGGIETEGTVMFSDVRGFTTFSETNEPARVMEVLNRYLSEMTDAILAHGGTLVAYTGDGIMAVFGAPLHQADHADRALAAGVEMLTERLTSFNEWAQTQGIGHFEMGVGLNSGVFIAGNVGSLRRLEYTVIGDTTNTAARLESMTKGTGHSLFMAESTRASLTRPAPPLEFVGEFPVRGREANIRVWGLAERIRRGSSPDLDESAAVPAPGEHPAAERTGEVVS
jgi:adenylate cyclase